MSKMFKSIKTYQTPRPKSTRTALRAKNFAKSKKIKTALFLSVPSWNKMTATENLKMNISPLLGRTGKRRKLQTVFQYLSNNYVRHVETNAD